MKLSSAILALAACSGGSSAFQSSALAAGRINKRVVGGGYGAPMAATMDGTTAMSEQVANGARRKKTKQVGSMRRCQFGDVSLHVARRHVRGWLWAERIILGKVPPIFFHLDNNATPVCSCQCYLRSRRYTSNFLTTGCPRISPHPPTGTSRTCHKRPSSSCHRPFHSPRTSGGS